jgi:protein-disulfide isomerase
MAPESDSALGAILESAAEGREPSRPTSPRIPFEEQAQRPLEISEMGYDRGDSDAPVKVLEISDFGCGYCRLFHEEIFPDLEEIYVESGLVEWKYIPFVLGMFPNGLEAATAAECAGEQERFFPMQSRLFQEQRVWRSSQDPYELFSTFAGEEGLDVDRFESCIQGGWRETTIRSNIRLGQQVGARGTPVFLVDGRPLNGALPLPEFRRLLDAALLQKGVTPPPQ